MNKIRTLIVDDEPLARARIEKLLSSTDFVETIGECKTGAEALRAIDDYKPDLIFLDVQMPDQDGFEVIRKCDPMHLPFIIFVTAYDRYAIKAFDVQAVDYLLKPYEKDRFYQALLNAKRQIQLKRDALFHFQRSKEVAGGEEEASIPEKLSNIVIKDKGITLQVKVDDVFYFEAFGNYLNIHLAAKTYLLRQTLQNIESSLNSQYFKKIHRSIILNFHFIESVKYMGGNLYLFRFKNGKELLSSRRYKEVINQFLELESFRTKMIE